MHRPQGMHQLPSISDMLVTPMGVSQAAHLGKKAIAAPASAPRILAGVGEVSTVKGTNSMTFREWFARIRIAREQVDRFLDPSRMSWAEFDHELGYVPADCIVQDGMDNCYTIGRYETDGARQCQQYRTRSCRIHTYGNSFTQCHQVSDGETWQEYLAAHLGEPIRNYGVGGYGAYQAYRRLLRTEEAEPAEYLIFNIWVDDHHRSLMPCRYLFKWKPDIDNNPIHFHRTPWAHLVFELGSMTFREAENQLPTPNSLYDLCDATRLYELFQENLMVQLLAWGTGVTDLDLGSLRRLAEWSEFPIDFSSTQSRDGWYGLFTVIAHRSTMFLLDKLTNYCQQNGRKLLVALTYGVDQLRCALDGKPRGDQVIVDYLAEKGLCCFDAMAKHVEDYSAFRPDPSAYLNRYFIGHYNPIGNHFFAYALKNDVVAWLDPKPLAYRGPGKEAQF